MLTVYSEDHRLQDGKAELIDGTLKPCYESPSRADIILGHVRNQGLGEVISPERHGDEPILEVHRANYVDFLREAWNRWTAEGRDYDALPLNWQIRNMRDIEPDTIDGKLSYFSFDAGSPITAGTWNAAKSAVDVALTGLDRVSNGASGVFSLCRPPGHHAAADYYGGYCFLNNAAITAQAAIDRGADRVAILDIDYHHGNGTQSIFYDRADVLFASIHGDPRQEFPFFLGYADEIGSGAGEGANVNYPLPWGSPSSDWFSALDSACRRIEKFAPALLIVSLGVDTFIDDPISRFQLESDDYSRVGARIADIGLSTLFVMEGGYAVDALGKNVVNVLAGFEDSA